MITDTEYVYVRCLERTPSFLYFIILGELDCKRFKGYVSYCIVCIFGASVKSIVTEEAGGNFPTMLFLLRTIVEGQTFGLLLRNIDIFSFDK